MLFIHNDFKTIQLAVYFTDLDKIDTRVYRFLLPKMLTTHTNHLNSKLLMSQKLENLYGAYFSTKVEQIGNYSVISIVLTIVDPKIVEDQRLLDQALELFKDVIYGHNQFSKSIFNEEKRMLIEQWETLKDKKRLYAQTKFYEHFFENDKYGYPMSGTLEDAKKITLTKLKKYYESVFLNNATKLVVNGNVLSHDLLKIENVLKHENKINIPFLTQFREPRELKTVFEETDMNQAIVKIGYHFPIFRADYLYDAAVILDTILGGYPDSRLFQQIRELCYDIQSNYDHYKGVLTISSGVDIKNKESALDSIQRLVLDMISFGITNQELIQAKSFYQHQIKSSLDSQSVLTKRAFIRDLLNYDETIEEKLDKIDRITIEEVNEALKKLTIDTIYVLFGGQS
jgi:predicted Zn-dependent peptidase